MCRWYGSISEERAGRTSSLRLKRLYVHHHSRSPYNDADEQGTTVPSASKLLMCLSPSSLPQPTSGTPELFDDAGHPTLRPTYDMIGNEMHSISQSGIGSGSGAGTLVILDGLSELTYMGFEPAQIQKFVRAVLYLVRNVRPPLLPTSSAFILGTDDQRPARRLSL